MTEMELRTICFRELLIKKTSFNRINKRTRVQNFEKKWCFRDNEEIGPLLLKERPLMMCYAISDPL